jgi:prepilin-type N-terminal cleavage/methylation domain-containing protein
MKRQQGFTLIEMAVVLAIIAILAAIMTPLVTSYIDQARTTRAAGDVASIAKAYILHYRDTAYWPVFKPGDQTSGNPSVKCQVSGGTAAIPPSALGNTSFTGGVLSCSSAANVGQIANYLNLNTLGLTTGNPAAGGTAYRGPYLDGLNANDPWSNAYVVTSQHLSTNVQTNWAVAVSAGPNGVLDSNATQARTAPYAAGADDLVALIR